MKRTVTRRRTEVSRRRGVKPALVDSIREAAGDLAGGYTPQERQMVNQAPGGGPGFFREENIWVQPPECNGGDQA